ncbi:MAG: diacylglycerol kinase, partial [Proteobacteria bacterium]|nr:diacylglycerol kinase [Pseudomonadota bacterium]
MPAPEIKKPKNMIDSLGFCIEGIILGFKTEKHIRYHFVTAFVALIASLIFKLPATEFALLAVSIVILLFAEMVNTALEEVVNLLEENYNIRAKNAKDLAAGAVLVSSAALIIVVFIIFFKYIFGPMELAIRDAREFSGHLALITLLLVLISVVASKASFGRGRPLHGGMPSGHAAVAFSLWISVSLISLNPTVVIITLIMALLISLSRLTGRIHSPFEIFMG